MSNLLIYIWFAVSIAILLAGIIYVKGFTENKNFKYKTIVFTIFIFFANVVLLASIFYFGSYFGNIEDKEISATDFWQYYGEYEIKSNTKLGYSIFMALIFATKMAGLGLKYQSIIPAAFKLSVFYGTYLIFMTVITPIVFGTFIASFFEGFINIFKFRFYKKRRDVYYFSELNEKSFFLAKDIIKKSKKKKSILIVFCNKSKKIPSSLLEKTKNTGFILFLRSEVDFLYSSKHKRYYIELSDEDNSNFINSKKLLFAFQKNLKFSRNAEIHVFTENEDDMNALNECCGKEIHSNLIVHSRCKKIIYDYLFKQPLVNTLEEGQKDFNILIVGGGTYGRSVLKTCLWCTQLGEEYHTTINMVDKDINKIQSVLRKEAPEVFNDEYDINFYSADVNTNELIQIIKDHCMETKFIAVCIGDDHENVHTAVYLRNLFDSKFDKDYSNLKIAAVVESDAYLDITKAYMNKNRIDLIGSDGDFYSARMLFNNDLDNLAMNVNASYEDDEGNRIGKLKEFYSLSSTEYIRRSSIANAIHAVYKLYILGYEITEIPDDKEKENQEKLLAKLKQSIKENETELSYIEHSRWNAYLRTEGWTGIPVTKESFNTFWKKNRNKNNLTKQHICLCSWDDLKKINEYVSDVSAPDYQKTDFKMIKEIPGILGLDRDSPINITKVKKYYLKER